MAMGQAVLAGGCEPACLGAWPARDVASGMCLDATGQLQVAPGVEGDGDVGGVAGDVGPVPPVQATPLSAKPVGTGLLPVHAR
jgi:hypothetical protein